MPHSLCKEREVRNIYSFIQGPLHKPRMNDPLLSSDVDLSPLACEDETKSVYFESTLKWKYPSYKKKTRTLLWYSNHQFKNEMLFIILLVKLWGFLIEDLLLCWLKLLKAFAWYFFPISSLFIFFFGFALVARFRYTIFKE